jgi:hypothetical protein
MFGIELTLFSSETAARSSKITSNIGHMFRKDSHHRHSAQIPRLGPIVLGIYSEILSQLSLNSSNPIWEMIRFLGRMNAKSLADLEFCARVQNAM